jgi:uncharacterized glyoxalase superfamily protein PhnB
MEPGIGPLARSNAMPTPNEPPRIYPTFRYRDTAAMIDWLTTIFGFTVIADYRDDAGIVRHAELAFGSAMVMLGTVADDAYGAMVGAGVVPGAKSTYIAVDDPDALFARAEATDVTILEGLTDRDYGSRDFIVRDPEGNVWCFGTYWPKATDTA